MLQKSPPPSSATHLRKMDQEIDLDRPVIDPIMMRDSTTAMLLSCSPTRPMLRTRCTMPLKLVVVDAIGATPLHLQTTTQRQCPSRDNNTSRKHGFRLELLSPIVPVVFEPGTNDLFSPGSRGYRSHIALVPVQTRPLVPVGSTDRD
jgi:hypothetical protein